MKLAEALQERADLNKKIEELRRRIGNSALVQEGEEPAEDPGLTYQTAGTMNEGENYSFSAEVPRFGLEEIDSFFESKAARIYNGFLSELDESDTDGASFELTYEVTYNRGGIISVVFQKYAYFGGAYPNLSYDCDTIDTAKNARLLLSDVVSDTARLKELCWEYFPAEYAEAIDPEDAPGMIDRSFSEDLFSLDGAALHLYFPDYAFGYRGWTDAAVPYDALKAAGILADWVAD